MHDMQLKYRILHYSASHCKVVDRTCVVGGQVGTWYSDSELQSSDEKACLHSTGYHNHPAYYLQILEVTETIINFLGQLLGHLLMCH